MIRKTWIGLALAVALAQGHAAFACSCIKPPTPAEARNLSEAVVVGKVLEVAPNGKGSGFVVKLQVEQSWKGPSCTEMTVATGRGDGDCGYPFEVGKSYLVYAHKDGETLRTNICTRTKPLDVADEDLTALGAASQSCSG
jgi:hypothetical protein